MKSFWFPIFLCLKIIIKYNNLFKHHHSCIWGQKKRKGNKKKKYLMTHFVLQNFNTHEILYCILFYCFNTILINKYSSNSKNLVIDFVFSLKDQKNEIYVYVYVHIYIVITDVFIFFQNHIFFESIPFLLKPMTWKSADFTKWGLKKREK